MEMTRVLATDAGMHVVWDRAYFANVRDYATWATELLDDSDIERHIAAGHLVPINISSDGAFAVKLRWDEATQPALTDDESRHVVVTSDPYRFLSAGRLEVSGIEYVHREPDSRSVASASLAAGEYEARVHLLDWEESAKRTDEHPDFIVLLGPSAGSEFRTSLSTFDRSS
jgi:hypothetical protein